MAKSHQSFMNVHMGRGAGVNQYGQLVGPAMVPNCVNAAAGTTTLTASQSGSIVHTAGATAAVTITLPAIADGPFYFLIVNGADVDLTVAAATADTIITYNDLDIDSVVLSTSSEKIGGAMEVICDGTYLFVLPRPADGRYQTFTLND